jgi:hypothetical protein
MPTFHLSYAGVEGVKVVLNNHQQLPTTNFVQCLEVEIVWERRGWTNRLLEVPWPGRWKNFNVNTMASMQKTQPWWDPPSTHRASALVATCFHVVDNGLSGQLPISFNSSMRRVLGCRLAYGHILQLQHPTDVDLQVCTGLWEGILER